MPLTFALLYTQARTFSRALSLSLVLCRQYENLTGAHEKPKCRKIDTVLPCRKFSGEISAVPTAAAASATVFCSIIFATQSTNDEKLNCEFVCVYMANSVVTSNSAFMLFMQNRIFIAAHTKLYSHFFRRFFSLFCRIEYITYSLHAQHYNRTKLTNSIQTIFSSVAIVVLPCHFASLTASTHFSDYVFRVFVRFFFMESLPFLSDFSVENVCYACVLTIDWQLYWMFSMYLIDLSVYGYCDFFHIQTKNAICFHFSMLFCVRFFVIFP